MHMNCYNIPDFLVTWRDLKHSYSLNSIPSLPFPHMHRRAHVCYSKFNKIFQFLNNLKWSWLKKKGNKKPYTKQTEKEPLKKPHSICKKKSLSCFLFTAMASNYLIFQTHQELFAHSFINIYYWHYFALLKNVISMIIWSLCIYKKGRWTAEASFWILSSTDRLTFSAGYKDFLMWYECWDQPSSKKLDLFKKH